MKIVWTVYWGEYESRDVVAVFSTYEQASRFVEIANERNPRWDMYLDARRFQLAETDEDLLSMWPLEGELP